MVEITLPIVLQILQTIGILVGIIYYITVMRNSQKNQQTQLETRQLDLYLRWQLELTKPDVIKNLLEVLQLEWEDFDDFARKYSHTLNVEDSSKRFATRYYWEGFGYLLSRGMIDSDTVYEMISTVIFQHWIKYEPIIRGFRERDGAPETWRWFEYLVDEMKKVRDRRGMPEYMLPWRPE
ncbi:hypothetical protein DRO66_11230 [Candidatus Bathyarchaeota archaeon]|nr:MAG: hypothetical protein DRO66_11230 [Candidatus Bathyarchaeota archaeon]